MDKVMELYVRAMVELQAPRKGQGLVEYALILALISVVAILALTNIGTGVVTTLESVVAKL